MTCLYPHNTGQTAYWKGCRCDRCVAAKRQSLQGRERRRKCPSCGGWMAHSARTCMGCFRRPVIDRVMEKVEITAEECWCFQGCRTTPDGYGQINVPGRRMQVVHRITYEFFVGAIPAGLQLDHLCRNRWCVNPDHLEPVTPRENIRRARAAKKAATYWREAVA